MQSHSQPARPRCGRKAGGHNAVSPDHVQREASRHTPEALTALASIMADPTAPAEARALAASAILSAALSSSQTIEV